MKKSNQPVYVRVPLRPSSAIRVRALARNSERTIGRQVSWIVDRFLEER